MTPEEFAVIAASKADRWIPACGGTEQPFDTRSGKRLLYCWNPATGAHAYVDTRTDMVLTYEESQAALGSH